MVDLWKRISIGALLAGGLAATTLAQDSGYTQESLDRVKAQIDARKAILVDVREKREWDRGHIRDAVLVPLSQLTDWQENGISAADRAALLKSLPKGSVIYCHCAAGGRALPGGEMLRKLGYDARPLQEGFQSLLSAGFARSTM